MTDAGDQQARGRIVTFYSFKGGTGRTMALANVAWILAANGKRVLAADWDLESPGLHRFFQPFLDQKIGDKPGILDFIRRYEWAAVDADINPDSLISGSEESQRDAREAVARLVSMHAGLALDYAIPLNWQFPRGGVLDFLSAGRQRNGDYQATLSALDWDNFYDNLHGGQFFDTLSEVMKEHYDYVLIDSRTGLSDVADICTGHLPDIVVDCFTLATQGIAGAGMIAGLIQAHRNRNIKILPVPMRIDHAETSKADVGLAYARERFEGLPAGLSAEERDQYWATITVPYRSSYAYEEMLATFGDPPAPRTGCSPGTSGSPPGSPMVRSPRCPGIRSGCACAPNCCSPARNRPAPPRSSWAPVLRTSCGLSGSRPSWRRGDHSPMEQGGIPAPRRCRCGEASTPWPAG